MLLLEVAAAGVYCWWSWLLLECLLLLLERSVAIVIRRCDVDAVRSRDGEGVVLLQLLLVSAAAAFA